MLKKLLVVLVASAFTAGAFAQPAKPAEPAKSTEAAKKQARKEAKAQKDAK